MTQILPYGRHYWKTVYQRPGDMDGISNYKEHCRYLKSIFDLENIEIESVVDLGCGFGHILGELVRRFNPQTMIAVEPCAFALRQAKDRNSRYKEISFANKTIQQWCTAETKKKHTFDLGVCQSVLQYVSTAELKWLIPILAKKFRYLYLTVPTSHEYTLQRVQEGFTDPFAYRRSKEAYRTLLKPHFTFVGSRLLESKTHNNLNTTLFKEILFRH